MQRPSRLVVLALSASPLAAQAELVRAEGVLGGTVEYELSGDPGEAWILMPSLTNGPTPLSLLDPSDPRSLDVGWDLPSTWQFGALDGSGESSVVLPAPPQPGLQGVALYAQFLTAPGTTTLVDDLSGYTAFRLSFPGESVLTVEDPVAALDGHTATTLADGRVLLAGGGTASASALDGFDLFDPQTGAFAAATGTMQDARVTHTATRLADGRVLLLGGADETGAILSTGDVWDPATGLATPIAPMSVPRTQHSATLLADGRVFVAGGVELFDLSDPVAAIDSALASTAVWDPATNTWQAGPNLPKPRFGHRASLLPSGRVLVSGGVDLTNLIFVNLPDFSSDCRRYDPGSNSLVSTASLPGPRAYHGQVTLPNGQVLVSGGADGDLVDLNVFTLATTRRYDEGTNAWTNAASLGEARAYPNLLVAGGGLVALGGLATVDLSTGTGAPAMTIETADVAAAAWTSPSSLLLERALATAVAIEDGRRVLTTGTGDDGSGGGELTAEIFLP